MSRLLEAGHDERLVCCLEGDDEEGGKLRISFVVLDEDEEGEVMDEVPAWVELVEAG